MKYLLKMLVYLIAIACAMRAWQFNFPPRVPIFTLLCVAFILAFIAYYSVTPNSLKLKKELKHFIQFQSLTLIIIIVSGLNVSNDAHGIEAYSQFTKYVIADAFYLLFISLLIIYISNVEQGTRRRIVKYYILGVSASCIYGIIHMVVWKYQGIDIGKYIWAALSYNIDPYSEIKQQWAIRGIIRGVGFPGVGAAATYVATILPYMIYKVSVTKSITDKAVVIILLSGLIITMSRTGFLSFGVALLILVIFERSHITKLVKQILLVAVPIGYLAFIWWNNIIEISIYRLKGDSSRFEIFKGGMHLFGQHPLMGVGANNYSVARHSLPSNFMHDANLHNSWLTILVERGLIGLVIYVAFVGYMIRVASKKRNIFSRAFVATIIGLSFGAYFNEVFNLFYFKFYIAIAFTFVVLGDPDHLTDE